MIFSLLLECLPSCNFLMLWSLKGILYRIFMMYSDQITFLFTFKIGFNKQEFILIACLHLFIFLLPKDFDCKEHLIVLLIVTFYKAIS